MKFDMNDAFDITGHRPEDIFVFLNGRPISPQYVEFDDETGWRFAEIFATDNGGHIIPSCNLTDDLIPILVKAYGHIRIEFKESGPPSGWVEPIWAFGNKLPKIVYPKPCEIYQVPTS